MQELNKTKTIGTDKMLDESKAIFAHHCCLKHNHEMKHYSTKLAL